MNEEKAASESQTGKIKSASAEKVKVPDNRTICELAGNTRTRVSEKLNKRGK